MEGQEWRTRRRTASPGTYCMSMYAPSRCILAIPSLCRNTIITHGEAMLSLFVPPIIVLLDYYWAKYKLRGV